MVYWHFLIPYFSLHHEHYTNCPFELIFEDVRSSLALIFQNFVQNECLYSYCFRLDNFLPVWVLSFWERWMDEWKHTKKNCAKSVLCIVSFRTTDSSHLTYAIPLYCYPRMYIRVYVVCSCMFVLYMMSRCFTMQR